MSNGFKLLVLDVDGTTAASDGEALPTQRVIAAVQAAQHHLHVALATGRSMEASKPVIDALQLKGKSVFNGGAEIIDISTGKVMHRQLLPVATLRELVKLCLPFGFKIYSDADQYITVITNPDQITSPSAKIFLEAVNSRRAIDILEELVAVEGVSAHPTTSWTLGDVVDIHMTHEHATKRYGVEKLITLLGVSKQEVIAIGDGHNDLPMLEAAGFKVAMGNAPEEVKAVADHVAPSLDEDGVAVTIERFILQ